MLPKTRSPLPAYRIPTGELLKSLRPAKAIERAEAESIAESKAKLLRKVTRVAERAWSTVEDKLDSANLPQAAICAGSATEKMILLGGEHVQQIKVSITAPQDIYSELRAIQAEIVAALRPDPLPLSIDDKLLLSAPGAGDRAAGDRSAEVPALC
jgi:hypothetical protein